MFGKGWNGNNAVGIPWNGNKTSIWEWGGIGIDSMGMGM